MFVPEKPVTAFDRSRYESRLVELGPGGDPRELGLVYLKLAHIYKQIGPSDGRVPFAASAEAGQKALDCFRQTDDRRNLANALRASIVAFVTDNHPDAIARLDEALAITEELGDPEAIGWSHHAISTHAFRTQDRKKYDRHRDKAIEVWESSGQDMLVADALFQKALHDRSNPNQAEIYLKAGVLFERVKAYRNAAMALSLAAMGGEEEGWDRQRIREVARRYILNEQRSREEPNLKVAKRLLRRHRRHNRALKA